ncbi:MAG TPA: hypothetical protein VGA53_04215 [Candidatus Paceibacterota bacterium]
MKHIWSVLCQRSIVDQKSNNISLIDVLEQLNINVSPEQAAKISEGLMIPINFDIVSLWARKSEQDKPVKFEIIIDFHNSHGKKLKSFNRAIEVAQNYQRMRTQVKIVGLQIFESGLHTFKVGIKTRQQEDKPRIVAELPLDIKFILSAKTTKKVN